MNPGDTVLRLVIKRNRRMAIGIRMSRRIRQRGTRNKLRFSREPPGSGMGDPACGSKEKTMMRYCVAIVLMISLLFCASAFSQSSAASLSGTVLDATGAIVPGATIKATNAATGVVNTAVSNTAGIYNLPSLLPGGYKVTVEKPGFQLQTYTDVQLGNAAQVRLNCKLQVAGLNQDVEVNVAAERLILESSSSTGDVLAEKAVKELPLVNNNALDLVRTMSGYVPVAGNAVFNANDTTVGGVSVGNLNLQRDGVDISDVRYPAGIHSPTQINPDMVGEFRMVLSPVDAEMGRGNAQVQVLTKSGTNAYHGAGVWNIQNSALDSNQWDNNRKSVVPPWRNLNQYTLSLGGPIIKNKTFFFGLFDGQIARLRDSYNALALTPCARKGIFRYFDNWNNGYADQTLTVTGTATFATVDSAGNPITPPALQPSMLDSKGNHLSNWQPHNGIVRYASIFGPLLKIPKTNDCSDFTAATDIKSGSPWDPYRTKVDTTGFIEGFLNQMPAANNYVLSGTDGLNTAGARWTRGTRGADNMYGIGEDNQRKQINLKVDHIFNNKHRVNVAWSLEKTWADNNFKVWPNGYGGRTERQPQVITVNLNSTLSAALLNEARFGLMRTGNNGYFPLENPETGKELLAKLPKVNGLPLVISPGAGGAQFAVASSNFFGGRGALLGWTNKDLSPRWTYADNLTWIKGQHLLKGGFELRLNRTQSTVYGTNWGMNINPYATGGDPVGLAVQGINSTNMPGLAGTQTTGSQQLMQNLLNFFSGSLASVSQLYFINTANSVSAWNDPLGQEQKIRDIRQKEISFFVKDDWKVHENLTLNLGLRYEYYGVPFLKNGLTAGLKGGGNAAYGISGRNWEEAFWKPGVRSDMSELIFVGPDSDHPDQGVYSKDLNNFGPAIGFSWALPWFGKGRTTLRGGYQISFVGGGQTNTTSEGIIANPPGSTASATYTPSNVYLDLASVSSVVPVPTTAKPMATIPLTDRTQTISVYDPNFVTPYIQNLTLALTRNIGSHLTVDVRYVGTLTRKNSNFFNLNTPNFMTNGLLDAFNAARYGDDSNPSAKLLDQIFAPVRGEKSGAAYLRNPTGRPAVRTALANGNYSVLASTISSWANPNAPRGVTDNGWLLRTAGLPENFIVTNPQFGTVNLYTNWGTANYHSMQAQVTMRPVAGFSFQMSYTWSKNLGNPGTAYTDPLNRAGDYTVLGSDRPHVFTSYGNFDLPIGPSKFLFKNSTGALARFLENWQASWIVNVSSGSPANVTAFNMLYGTGVPDLVGAFPRDKIGVYWEPGAKEGNYFGNYFTSVDDPQKANVTTKDNLQAACTGLFALKDPQGNIVFQNPLPGQRGNFGQNRFYGPPTWNVDMAMSKSLRISETKGVQIRVDATNIFNHAQPSQTVNSASTRIYFANLPALSINGNTTPFGYLGTKVGSRTFQAKIRFNF